MELNGQLLNMIVEVDINVECPVCHLVMVRHREPDYVSCETRECPNHGIRFELPKVILNRITAVETEGEQNAHSNQN